jgi:signal transduction histidine kinase
LSTVQSLPDDERVAFERALVPLARLALIGRLAGDAAHDTGNALFGLVGLVDLLQEGEPLVRERIELLHRSSAELQAMIVPLLELSRGADGRRTADLAATADRAVALARRGRFVPASPFLVACPPELVLQAVLHLVLAAAVDAQVELVEGSLQVSPAGEPSFDELVARRIAVDHGGSLERRSESLVLRLPPV